MFLKIKLRYSAFEYRSCLVWFGCSFNNKPVWIENTLKELFVCLFFVMIEIEEEVLALCTMS